MTSPLAGEFFGTMILILLGDGAVAAVLLKRSKAEGGGWMVITAGWAFAVMAGVFTAIACGSSDAHLNPAVTIGFAVREGNFAKFAPYLAAQMLGAIVGAALVWLLYFSHWKETPDTAAKLGCFCTAPAIRNTIANLMSEIIATFVLVFVVGAIFSKGVSAAARRRTRPVSRGELGLGHRSLSRWADRIRDQSGTRPRAAHRARDSSDCRERRLGLGLCPDSLDWTSHRWRAGWRAVARARDFLIRAESGHNSADSWQRFSSEWRTGKNVESAAKKEPTKQ